MDQSYMKEKPILPLVLSMSLPMVLSMLVSSLYNIVDSYFVAKISEDAMTALSLVFPIQNFINAVTIGFSIGVNAVIAYYLGAQKNREADTAAAMGLFLNLIHGILLTVGCISIMPFFLRMFTSDRLVIELGLRYSRIAFGFSVCVALGMTFEKIYQAVGKMTMAMSCVLSGCIANLILDPLLIFGLGPFPELGIEGAALATGIGQTINLVVYIAAYMIHPLNLHIGPGSISFRKDMVGKLYAIGIPATLNLALPSLLVSALNIILSAYSQAYVVILGIYYKLQTFLYLPANGIIQGMRPLIGYNYGAREHKRVQGIYRTALAIIAVIMLLGTVLCWTFPGQLIGLFTDNDSTIRLGMTALRIISIGFLLSSVSVAAAGALEGLSMGMPSLLITTLRYVVIIIPAAFLLNRILEANGVWCAFPVAEGLTALAACCIYRRAVRSAEQEPS